MYSELQTFHSKSSVTRRLQSNEKGPFSYLNAFLYVGVVVVPK